MSKDEQDDKIVYLIDRKSLSPQAKRLFATNWLRKEITKALEIPKPTPEEINVATHIIASEIYAHFSGIDEHDHLITALKEFAGLIEFTLMETGCPMCQYMSVDLVTGIKPANDAKSIT